MGIASPGPSLLPMRSPWGSQPLAFFLEEAASLEVLPPTPKDVENSTIYVLKWRQDCSKLGPGQGKVAFDGVEESHLKQ